MLVAAFVLMALHRNRTQVEAAFKYVAINLIASSIFLTALGLLYGVAGSLNMAELGLIWPSVRSTGLDMVLAALFVVAFSIKAGLFPLFFWLPASYHTPPAVVGALFAGLLAEGGVYCCCESLRCCSRMRPRHLHGAVVMSVATMDADWSPPKREDFRRIFRSTWSDISATPRQA